jgi:glycosyltransferase involved in cell wall biosynthesis
LRGAPGLVVWFAGGEGRRGERAALHARAARLGVSTRVRWLGWRDDVPELLAACDLVAFLPAREEGFGLPLIEAMAAGRPLITLDRGPAAEIVIPGVTGILVAPRPPGTRAEDAAPAALALAVKNLALDAAARERLGRAARREAEQRFDLPRMARAFEEVFERTARRGGQRSFPV